MADKPFFFPEKNNLSHGNTGDELKGKLIVLEGTDGVGRSTQIDNLKTWLEFAGHGVITTGLTRSPLMQKAIENAKAGHNLNVYTYSLLYLADFADRLEQQIIPALKAGFIVLSDRYVYTAFARAVMRGARRDWVKSAYSFALKPDIVFYLKISVENLIPRVINAQTFQKRYWESGLGEGMDYWESGMDLKLGEDFYDSFVEYQKMILAEFDTMAKEFNFRVLDASGKFELINQQLQETVGGILTNVPAEQ